MARGTPLRNVRIPDSIWQPALQRASEHGESVSDVVRRALTEYAQPDTDTDTDTEE